jgi:hypothetical protein
MGNFFYRTLLLASLASLADRGSKAGLIGTKGTPAKGQPSSSTNQPNGGYMPRKLKTDLIATALDRSIVLHQQFRRQLLVDLLMNTDASVNDVIAVVNWIMTQPAD